MTRYIGLGVMIVLLAGCGPTLQWTKPGATEADLRTAITLCDRESGPLGRGRLTTEGMEDDVMVTRERRYRRGAGEFVRDDCLRRRGWRQEYVE